MLKWYRNYYIGEGIKNPNKIQWKLNAGKLVPSVYLVTLSYNSENLLEIIPAAMLKQKTFYNLCPMIIGIAKGKEEAMDMASNLLVEVYEKTGAFQVQEYLKNR